MGSFRFRRSVRIAPGVRLNINKRSVGVSAGLRGARVSVNSDGRSTRSVGIPGTGLYYRSQTGPSRASSRRVAVGSDGQTVLSPTRLVASTIGWLTLLIFVIAILNGASHFAGTMVAIGLIVYFILRIGRGVFDPLLISIMSWRTDSD